MGFDGHYWMALNESWKSVPESWYRSWNKLDSRTIPKSSEHVLGIKINERPWIIPKIFLTLTCVCHWTTLNMLKPCILESPWGEALKYPTRGAHLPTFYQRNSLSCLTPSGSLPLFLLLLFSSSASFFSAHNHNDHHLILRHRQSKCQVRRMSMKVSPAWFNCRNMTLTILELQIMSPCRHIHRAHIMQHTWQEFGQDRIRIVWMNLYDLQDSCQ